VEGDDTSGPARCACSKHLLQQVPQQLPRLITEWGAKRALLDSHTGALARTNIKNIDGAPSE